MAITQIPIRAQIFVGGATVVTPYIVSFNVHRRRGAPATFDASVKIDKTVSGSVSVGGGVTIFAGSGSMKKIFTGVVKGAKLTPCWDDPGYVILTVTGDDTLSLIKGKKYTRRCRGTDSTFCIITDVTRAGLKSGKFAYVNENVFEMDEGLSNMDLPSHGTNVDIKTIKGVGDAGGADELRAPIKPTISIVSGV